jgi:hypothetical protein
MTMKITPLPVQLSLPPRRLLRLPPRRRSQSQSPRESRANLSATSMELLVRRAAMEVVEAVVAEAVTEVAAVAREAANSVEAKASVEDAVAAEEVVIDQTDHPELREKSTRDAQELKVRDNTRDAQELRVRSTRDAQELRVRSTRDAQESKVRSTRDAQELRVKPTLDAPDQKVLKATLTAQEPRVVSSVDAEEVALRELRVPRARLPKAVTRASPMFRERNTLITTERITTSKVREENNGTRTTERTVPAEAEVPPREATERATGEPPLTKLRKLSSPSKVSKVKHQLMPRRLRMLQLRRLRSTKKRREITTTATKSSRRSRMTPRHLPSLSTRLRRRSLPLRRRQEAMRRSRAEQTSKLLPRKIRRLLASAAPWEIRRYTTSLLARTSSLSSFPSRLLRKTSTSRDPKATAEVAEVAEAAEVAREAASEALVVADPKVLPEAADSSH